MAERPQAVFAMDDTLAAGVLKGARKLGLAVPGEVAIAGFNGDLLSSLLEPALTTVRIPIFEMGREARMPIEIINGAPPRSVTTPAELIVRQSSLWRESANA